MMFMVLSIFVIFYIKKKQFYFNITIMFFNQVFPVLIFICFFIHGWISFLRQNFLSARLQFGSNDKIHHSKFLRKNDDVFFMDLGAIFCFCCMYFLLFFEIHLQGPFWGNHLYISTNSIFVVVVMFITAVSVWSIFFLSNKSNLVSNSDFYFSLINLSLIMPFLFFVNSFYSFIFVLELISLIVLYKFVVSRFWIKNKKKSGFFEKKSLIDRIFSKPYVNVLFFQYWINFFSSVIIMFSIANVLFQYGSSDWFFLNFICFDNKENIYFYDFEYDYIFWAPFFIAVFFKIGLSPAHLF